MLDLRLPVFDEPVAVKRTEKSQDRKHIYGAKLVEYAVCHAAGVFLMPKILRRIPASSLGLRITTIFIEQTPFSADG